MRPWDQLKIVWVQKLAGCSCRWCRLHGTMVHGAIGTWVQCYMGTWVPHPPTHPGWWGSDVCPRQCSTPAPLSRQPQITCGGLSVPLPPPRLTFFPSHPLCFPSICGGASPPSFPLGLRGKISLPSFVPPQFVAEFPSHCQTLSALVFWALMTPTRLSQWRYECFSGAINTQRESETKDIAAGASESLPTSRKPDFRSSNFQADQFPQLRNISLWRVLRLSRPN